MASFGHDIIFIVEISFFGDRRMLYRMAGYCRLSKEDGENRISESIENQKKLFWNMWIKPGICSSSECMLTMDIPGFIFRIDHSFSR